MSHVAAPVKQPFWSPGARLLGVLVLIGGVFAARRYMYGIGAVSNLSDAWPWGIWNAIDVASGVALAAGGFTTAALAHVFHRHQYHALVRPALITAMLGYTFVALSLLVDLGKFYNIWHPILPSMWSGHSVLFEVGICVMCYLTVLYIEFMPIVVERFKGRVALPGVLRALNRPLEALMTIFDRTLGRVMALFIIAGVLLSCLHQSSLGALMVIVPNKLHPLWHTPVLPLLFLMSAVAVGFPMVIVESMWASRAFGRAPEMELLRPLAKIIPALLSLYLAFKLGDMVIRETYRLLWPLTSVGAMFLLELIGGVMVPLGMLINARVRRTPRLLLTAALMVVLGVMLNRINVFVVAYTPVFGDQVYVPHVGEVAITIGFISGLVLCYRALVLVFPVLPDGETVTAKRESRKECEIDVIEPSCS